MLFRGGEVSVAGLVVDLICCAGGFGVIAFAIYIWSGCGFSFGPDHHVYPGAPDPSFFARWLLLLGLGITAYFGFSLWSRFIDSD